MAELIFNYQEIKVNVEIYKKSLERFSKKETLHKLRKILK